jgi:hypothetical protein
VGISKNIMPTPTAFHFSKHSSSFKNFPVIFIRYPPGIMGKKERINVEQVFTGIRPA